MSKYDVEVEARIKKIEARLDALEKADKAGQVVGARFLELEDKVNKLWN